MGCVPGAIPSRILPPGAPLSTACLENSSSWGRARGQRGPGTLVSPALCICTEQFSHSTRFWQPLPHLGNCLRCPCPLQLPCRGQGRAVLLATGHLGACPWSGSGTLGLWLQGLPPALRPCRGPLHPDSPLSRGHLAWLSSWSPCGLPQLYREGHGLIPSGRRPADSLRKTQEDSRKGNSRLCVEGQAALLAGPLGALAVLLQTEQHLQMGGGTQAKGGLRGRG